MQFIQLIYAQPPQQFVAVLLKLVKKSGKMQAGKELPVKEM